MPVQIMEVECLLISHVNSRGLKILYSSISTFQIYISLHYPMLEFYSNLNCSSSLLVNCCILLVDLSTTVNQDIHRTRTFLVRSVFPPGLFQYYMLKFSCFLTGPISVNAPFSKKLRCLHQKHSQPLMVRVS